LERELRKEEGRWKRKRRELLKRAGMRKEQEIRRINA